MCLTSKWRFPKKAEHDIVCYKILEKDGEDYLTPYMDTIVDITKPFKAKGISKSIFGYEKGSGYIHTISSIFLLSGYLKEDIFNNPKVFKCIIPKGTKYHESKCCDEYCSKEILFKRLVSSYELIKR